MDLNEFEQIKKNFGKRNIEVCFFKNLNEAKEKILAQIPKDNTVGFGNSGTLKQMDISNELTKRGNIVYDKTLAKNKKETVRFKKNALLSKWFLTGTNAVSTKGHIVNIDHSGNRVAAMLYGSKNVIIVIGKNKKEESLEQAIDRAKNTAAPLNAKRAGYNPPCVELNKCTDCDSKERVCNSLVIIEGQTQKDRIKVFIIDQECGF
ncbi:MAG: lactate utilization protein [Bacillota bacterium]